jgi:predicted HTH domain antitoxin
MSTRQVDVPQELLERLQGSRLGQHSAAEQVKIALAIHLFLEGLISMGKAAELAGEPRVDFEWLISQMGLPIAHYDANDLDQDRAGLAESERRDRS